MQVIYLAMDLYTDYFKNTTQQQKDNLIKNWQMSCLDIFLKKIDLQMENKHMKTYSMLLVIREMKISTFMRYSFKCTAVTIIKKYR